MAHAAVPALAVAVPVRQETQFSNEAVKTEGTASAVSWAAVIAGAFAAAALSLSLLALGTGVGLSSISPWSDAGRSASAIGAGTVLWIIVTQMIAAAVGGYLAGRLRTKWVNIHTDEVYFRDTAHGFLVWAVGLVITAAFLASAATSLLGGGAQAGAVAARSVSGQPGVQSPGPSGYFTDMLFRSQTPAQNSAGMAANTNAEAADILANALRGKEMPAADRTYLGQLVAARTGLDQNAAEQRVSQVLDQARQSADTARKAMAHTMYWTFLALLIGAFCSSLAATIGGRERDRVHAI